MGLQLAQQRLNWGSSGRVLAWQHAKCTKLHLHTPLSAGCSEVHGTFKRSVPSGMAYRHAAVSFGADDWSRAVTDAAAVARVKAQLAALEGDMEGE